MTAPPAATPSGSSSAVTGGPDQLLVNIKVYANGSRKIGINPDTFRSPMEWGYTTEVYGQDGLLEDGCYVKTTLFQGNTPVYRGRTACSSSVSNITVIKSGRYRLVIDITTDQGLTGTGEKIFQVEQV
nr:hypothetical protein GCM10020093_024380 [Planobispora longispora]